MNILIGFHSDSTDESKLILSYLTRTSNFSVHLINEIDPSPISIRCELVKKCNAFIVISSRNFQKSSFCLEVINFVKDLKKPIFTFNKTKFFRPFGGLGAIIYGLGENSLINLDETETLEENLIQILNRLNEIKNNLTNVEPIQVTRPGTPSINLNFLQNEKEIDVLVSHHADTKEIAEIIKKALAQKEIPHSVEDSSLGTSNVKNAKCIVIIMSAGYELSYASKTIVDTARLLKKPIIPVSTTREWKPSHWLGLIVAGKLFFRIMDQSQAYKAIYDSTPMNDLIYEIVKTLAPKPTVTERDKTLIESLNARIDECKLKLNHWPPLHKNRKQIELKPVKIDFKVNPLEIDADNTHYTITRLSFLPPRQLYDNHGVPIREKFDLMISYQWKQQELVRNIYMDLNMRNLRAWFDIWGGMEGATNDAMATAIESSKVIVVFLSNSYQKSQNCKLEFKYACSLGKPFIFILTEPNLVIESWIKPYYDEMLKFEIFQLEDENILHDGWSRIDLIGQAVRDLGFVQPDISDLFELNEEVIRLRELLQDALDDIDALNNTRRFKTCTRCKKEYDENSLMGCKKHGAYFLDGTIIAPRWVCCNQHDQYSHGCVNATHTDVERKWHLDEDYGTYSWKPP